MQITRKRRITYVPIPILVIAGMLLCGGMRVSGQIAGETPTIPDTLIVFEPAEPLMANADGLKNAKQAFGLDILFSGSGWGFGGFYHHRIADNTTAFVNVGVSPRRNTDEFENAYLGNIPVVSSKVNRLFMIPVTFGVNYRLFAETLQESFRPFASAGITPTVILQTPYIVDGVYYEFFNSFSYTQAYLRLGAMFCIGSLFGDPAEGNITGVTIRYYTIPFGDDGLESIQGNPITNFGGIFLSLSIGTAF